MENNLIYLQPLIEEFKRNENPSDAFFMKKYMKNMYEFLGIKAPRRREIQSSFFKTYGLPQIENIGAYIKYLWSLEHREYQQFGNDLVDKVIKKLNISSIETLEYIIINKSWWDTVDFTASNLVGPFFKKFPELIIPTTEKWMKSNNMWLHRTCLLFQLKYKKSTDFDLLKSCIQELMHSKEFFIRKIGREHV